MKVHIAAKAGFCFGVKRAIDMAVQSARKRDGPLYSLGPLIHNPQVVASLAREGIKEIENLEQVSPGGSVVIRSHGVKPELYRQAEHLELDVVDATCPFVSKAQQTVKKLKDKGYDVVIVGEKSHPEVRGLVGWANGEAVVIKDAQEASELTCYDSIGVIAQTTQSSEKFWEIVEVLKSKCESIQVWDTICHATGERQNAARELAGRVDVMIVVGGYNSANTKKLAALCRDTGTPTYHVEVAEQLETRWFEGVDTAGITAGASTPDWIIEEVCRYMKAMDEKNINEKEEEVQEEPVSENQAGTEEPEAAGEQMEQDMEQDMEAMNIKALNPGEIVQGTVVQVTDNEILVDVGAKSEGIIPLKELSTFSVSSPGEIVQVGDKIDVLVLKGEDDEGRIVLSKARADAENAWSSFEDYMEKEESVEGTVKEVVKGGLLVDIGIRAFLPASLVEEGYVEDLQQYVGQNVEARIIELNRSRKKVVLSRKSILEEERAQKKQEVLENVQEGDVVKGIVRRITNFGAFIDIGGIDGLLHISEMAWYRIDHPSDVVNVGDELEVKVLRVEPEKEKVSLGLKQVLPNPWDNVENKYPVDSIVPAKVVRIAPFGAFVQLEPGVEGLVHISHLAEYHVEEPGEIVSEGDEINVKVLSVDSEEKRIRLSLREAIKPETKQQESNKQEVRESKKQPERKKKEEAKPVPPKQAEENEGREFGGESDGGSVTIGEMVGDIFKNRAGNE